MQRAPQPAATGNGPRIVFDATSFDFGKVPFNKTVEHSFVFRNSGDATLILTEKPKVDLIEGC